MAVLVDEYDKPILDALGTPEVARANRDYLHGLYSVIKSSDAHIKFTFLTGVSKFSKVSLFSGLNNLTDITLNPRYAALCGYTDADLDTTFAPELPGLDRQAIRDWYNGYSWLGEEKLYNPFDVLQLFFNRRFKAYWFETGTPTFLVETLLERRVGSPALEEMIGADDLLSKFDVDDIATEALLFQTGYLTIVEEKDLGGTPLYRLGYPNREVKQSLNRALLRAMGPDPSRQGRCSGPSSPASPTSGTRRTPLPTTKATTPACSTRGSRRSGWTYRWRTAAASAGWTWRCASTATCISSSSRWWSCRRRARRWRN